MDKLATILVSIMTMACFSCSSSEGSSPDSGSSGAGGDLSSETGGTGVGAGGTIGGTGGTSGGGGGAGGGSSGTPTVYGQVYSGGEFHLGPVDYQESKFHNACAPSTKYAAGVRNVEGTLLAGLWNGIPNVESYCDACIFVNTARGKSALLRVVTYGDTTSNSIDVSEEAYRILNSDEYPRHMSWQFAKCPDSGPLLFEFQTASSEWWTSLWVRSARVPITKAEVKSANHANYATLQRGNGDGTLTDGGGFGNGPFTIRLTGMDGQVITESFSWPAGGLGGKTLTGKGNFQ